MGNNHVYNHTAAKEIEFLTKLRAEKPEAFARQVSLILRGWRRFDATVDVAVVVRAVKGLITGVEGA